ncbi:MAG TPA: hypothetical protein VK826_05160 [Bacteroidia bacterium]|nr:hypothetical protein [Bacteroidia bacterium]
MKNLLNIFVLVCLAVSPATSQTFRWEVPVEPVDSPGYHRILMQPEVTGAVQWGFPDVRIYDSAGIEIPYLIVYDTTRKGIDRLVELPITDRSDDPKNSFITIMNPLHYDGLNHLVLEVNNADATRRMTLSGSYDNQNWFAVKDEYTTTYYETFNGGEEKTTNLVRFDFPPNDYTYYRFSFDNWSEWWKEYRSPVFVVRAGRMERTTPVSIRDNWMELPGVSIQQTENKTLKMSEIDIVFADTQLVDYLKFDLSTVNPTGEYLRGARLYEITNEGFADNKPPQQSLLSITMLSSEGPNEIRVHGRRVKHLLLRIVNADDQPLRVEKVHAIQVKSYLVANLNPAMNYTLRFGNDTVQFPEYDLKYFLKNNVIEMPVVSTGSRKALEPPTKPKVSGVNSVFEDNTLIWGAIVIVVLILGLMSVKMLREMKKK